MENMPVAERRTTQFSSLVSGVCPRQFVHLKNRDKKLLAVMSYLLSILDKSPVVAGETATSALRRTIDLAKRAEKLGYHRFWLAEHHGAAGLAGVAPEILASHLLAHTDRIRVGSGGVMLQHYSPYKVAESFQLLAALAPGRVDLGIGKAPGGLPFTTRALQWERRDDAAGFDEKLQLLDGFLRNSLPADHALAGAVANPRPEAAPERFLLGASPESAVLAARLGWSFVYAGHFNGDPAQLTQTLGTFATRAPSQLPMLALAVLVTHTEEEAKQRLAAHRTYRVTLETGQSVNVGSREQAAEFARQAGVTRYATEERRPAVLAGTAEQVRTELSQLASRYGIGEFVLDLPVPDEDARIATIELLAQDRVLIAA